MRSVPNTALTMGTYETIIFFLHKIIYKEEVSTNMSSNNNTMM